MRAERNYEGKRWVTYDRQFRRQALARKDRIWSVTDPRLYNKAFTGRACSIARCSFCLQDDHTATHCPHNPNGPYFGWFLDPTAWPSYIPPSLPQQTRPPAQAQEICRRFNDGRCKYPKCKYRHACMLAAHARVHTWQSIALPMLRAKVQGEAAPRYELQQVARQASRLHVTDSPSPVLQPPAAEQ